MTSSRRLLDGKQEPATPLQLRQAASRSARSFRSRVIDALNAGVSQRYQLPFSERFKRTSLSSDEPHFYPKFASTVLKFVFRGCVAAGTTRVMVYTDRLPVQKKKDAVEKAIKTTCRNECGTSMPFEVYHHDKASNCWIQIVDYCSWAVFKKWEKGDSRTYDQLKSRLQAPELDVFAAGDQNHYY
jgi:hypothetical protein